MWQERLVFNLANGTTLVVTQANIWQGGLTVEQSVSSDGFFEIGSTHIGQMLVSLFNSTVTVMENADFSLSNEGHLLLEGEPVSYDVVYDNIDFNDAVVVVSMAKDSDTLQQIGVYNVVTVERDNGIITITAYDNMNRLSEPYSTSLTFPSTYGAMANEITGQTLTFDGSTTAVAEKPEGDDLTKREVLGYIAQACGYNVLCDNLGRFQFVRYNMSGFDTEGSYHAISGLYDFHHSEYPVVITGVKVIVTDEEMTTDPDTGDTVAEIVTHEYTAGTDAYQLVIEENPLITTTNGQAVADALYALYGNVEFYTGDVSHLSDLSIKASDIMKVTDRHNNTYPMLVSRTVISTGSAQNTSSYAEEPSRKIVAQPSQMSRIQNSVRQAAIDAKNGKRIASNTNQYFWHTETGSDTGAHITEIPREDFLDDPTNGGGNLLARSNGIAVRDGLDELATFGANGSTIGKTNDTHLEMDYRSIKGKDKEGNKYFDIGDLRDANGVAEAEDLFDADGDTNVFALTFPATSILHVYVLGDETDDYTFNNSNNTVTVSTSVAQSGDPVEIFYLTNTILAKSYTLGIRSANSTRDGFMSTAIGYDNKATANYSTAIGSGNWADGTHSSAIGKGCKTIGEQSYAGGLNSVAEGACSYAYGNDVCTEFDDATSFGRFNDYTEPYLFCVGNGTDDNNRSNAFAVTSQGALVAGGVKSYAPTWETGQDPVRYHCVVSAGLCSFFFMGAAVAHSSGDLICTLPEGARPSAQVNMPFIKMTGGVVGVLTITTAGAVTVGSISSTTNTGRIYFNCSYPVV